MNLDGSDPTPLVVGYAQAAEPDVAPDGSGLVWVRQGDDGNVIFAASADGSGAHPLTPGGTRRFGPRFSPNGSTIAFTTIDFTTSPPVGNLWTMNADGTNAARVNFIDAGIPIRSASWAPDGHRLVIDRTDGAALYIVDLDARTVEQVYTGRSLGPVWSRDGSLIAFCNDDDSTLRVMAADAPSHPVITRSLPNGCLDPAWMPDGTAVLVGGATPNMEITVVRLSDGHQSDLTNDPASDEQPSIR